MYSVEYQGNTNNTNSKNKLEVSKRTFQGFLSFFLAWEVICRIAKYIAISTATNVIKVVNQGFEVSR